MKKESAEKHKTTHAEVESQTTVEPANAPASPEPSPLETAQAEVAALKDRLLRAQADWDNSRKRIMREKEDAVRYASEALLERLLPVLDNFEMGMQAAKTATDAKSISQGFEMVLSQLQQVLRDAGVEAVEAVGHPFDPHRHEALGHHETDDHPEGHVITQMRKGYKLKDRLLRPASVFVAKPTHGKASSHAKND